MFLKFVQATPSVALTCSSSLLYDKPQCEDTPLAACPVAGGHLGFQFSVLLSTCVGHSVVSDSLRPLQTVASLDPLSMGFSRQENWNGLPFPSSSYIYIYVLGS